MQVKIINSRYNYCHYYYTTPRFKAQNKNSRCSHYTSGGFLEAIDSAKLPPEPDISENGKTECIELNEFDEIQEDKDGEDHNFKDTTPTGQ